MKLSHKLKWFAGIVLGLLCLLLIATELFPNGLGWYVDHPQYALWRLGLRPFDDRVVYQGLIGDSWADKVVRGKTVPELRATFHDIREISEFDRVSLAKVAPFTNATCTFVKWGEHDFFIEITNGRARTFNLWKG